MERETNEHTQYYSTRLPKVERFACSRKNIKETFGHSILNWVSLGKISKKFEYDHRCTHRPKIRGMIIAALTITRENETYLCMYPIRREHYSDAASEKFKEDVLPSLLAWTKRKLNRSDTACLGYEEIMVEWDDNTHQLHEIRLKTS